APLQAPRSSSLQPLAPGPEPRLQSKLMAKIIGALASSHTPTIGFAFDRNKREDPDWAPIFKHYEPLQQWIEDKQPDVMIFVFNDHVTSFFFDHYSAFTLGIGEKF